MKKLYFILMFILIAVLGYSKPQDIKTEKHQSKVLNCEKTYNIYIPPDAKPGEKFPVLYIMHGAYGSYVDWVTKTNVADLADNYRMILVFPDGGQFGWYVDSPVEKDSQYDTYISKELPELIESKYPALSSKEARAIMGLSMGGHGAISLAIKHQDRYQSASSLSGILNLTNHPDKWEIAKRLGPYAENKEAWEKNSVFHIADKLTSGSVQLLFDCGVEDTGTGAITDGRQAHDKLVKLRIPHLWRELAGNHNWEYWQTNLEAHLNFHQAAMLKSTPEPNKLFTWYFGRLGKFFRENSMLALETKSEKKTLCLLGSSSMQGMPDSLFPDFKVYNRGVVGDHLGLGMIGISHRLEESAFDMKPDYLVIKCGRNDLTRRLKSQNPSIEELIAAYEDICKKMKARLPETKIVILTSFPVRDKYANIAKDLVEYNKQLAAMADKNNIPYLDTYKELVGEDGLLKKENSADGLHLSKQGKEIVAKMITEFFEEE